MALIETEGIVLRAYNLAEADRIIVLFTKSAGLVRGVARGSRRLKSKFGGALEPLTTIHVTFAEKEGRELVVLQNADIRNSLFPLSGNPGIAAFIGTLSNLIQRFAPPHEPNDHLYRMLLALISVLKEDPGAVELMSAYFLIWLLKLSGFLPDVRACSACREKFVVESKAAVDVEYQFQCLRCAGATGRNYATVAMSPLLDALKVGPAEFRQRQAFQTPETLKPLQQVLSQMVDRILEVNLNQTAT
jgi:DNA repair protein RecO